MKPCPFCGGLPWFNYLGWQDDRRYVAMTLECCATMQDAIGWRRARDMQETAIQAELRASLTLMWNERYVEEEA